MTKGPELGDAVKDEAAAITLQVQLDGGKQMVLQTYMRRDAPIAEYHGVVDKLYRVVERQQWKADIVGLNGAIEQEERSLKAQEADFLRLGRQHAEKWAASGRKGDPKLTDAEKSQRQVAETNIQRFRDEIAKKKQVVAELEARLKAELTTDG